jgi:hypothetical protein
MSRLLLILVALLSYLTLAAHFVLGITTFNPAALVFSLLGFLQFFTILTNLLLACAFTAHAFYPQPLRAFTRPTLATALALYALVLQLIYTGYLRWQWHPTGFQLPIDIALHDILPIAYLLLWIKKIPKGSLRYKDALPWLLFPLAFLPWNALCSHLLHNNPYPFLDPARITYPGLLLSIFSLLALFLLLSLAFIKLDRRLAGNH